MTSVIDNVTCFPTCFVCKDEQQLGFFERIMVKQCGANVIHKESGWLVFTIRGASIHAVCQGVFIEMQLSHRWDMVYIQDEIKDYSKIYDLAETTISGPRFGSIICGWNGPAFFKIDDEWGLIK